MRTRPGFDIKEQAQAFGKVIAFFGFSAGIMLAGEGLRRLIGWTLTDIPGREHADAIVDVVTLTAAGVTALGTAAMSMFVFLDDLWTDLQVRARYNAGVRSGQLEMVEGEQGVEES